MHQLAIALHNKGYRVTGSDDESHMAIRMEELAEQ